jgi:uncharacterized protein (TIGR03437 family)
MRAVPASVFLVFSALSPLIAQIALNTLPTRVIGQDSLTIKNFNPNLVEGREFFNPQGIALDLSMNPPALYVADSGNNRVLAFHSANAFANGATADFAIGQVDLMTTFAYGPGTSRTSGLSTPTGLTVDASGNLYVVDGANNRILRFPKPFSQSGAILPDLVIGQPGFSTSSANQGGISAATLSLTTSGTTMTSYLAVDASGNLWATDPGNNRILRYNAKVLGSQPTPGPSADLVLGQSDFVTATYTAPASPLTSLFAINTPTGIAFDSGGRLFVSESVSTQRGRILVWNPPFASGQFASRILGVDLDSPQPPTISPLQLGTNTGALFAVGSQIGIADLLFSRLLIYPPASQWTSNMLDQTASQVIGQPDFNSGTPNQGNPGAGASTLANAAAAAFSGTELYIADSANNRVIVVPQTGSTFGPATRVLGQDGLGLNAVNLLEGREFDFAGGSGYDAGVAVDLNSNPPHLYVADTYNNRILGYNDLRNIQPGAKADIVIGQPDFQHQWYNYPSNSPSMPNQSGLNVPTGLAVDASGNLYVADTGNSRVLRFPAPFANYVPGTPEPADLVLGQQSFFFTITDPTDRTMAAPYGLALTNFPGLLVSDLAHSRVLFFQGPTFTSGQAATRVFGQPDFNSAGAGSGMNQLSAPHHIANDSDDRLYVADTGNGRVMIFDHAPNAAVYPQAAYALTSGLVSPRGLHVDDVNGDIWVADAAATVTGTSTLGAAIRYPAYNALEVNGYQPNAILSETSPRAVTEDPWGNVFVADAVNRVVIHYPGLSSINAASYLSANILAPGMIAAMFSTGNFHQFGTTSQAASSLPLPTQLNGVQVLYNGSPVPLFYAGTDQINFQVPNLAPQSGTADVQVLEVATGRVLGDSTVLMNAAEPGLFTQAGNGSGAAAALNEDGTLNSQNNPAISGHYITLYGTGVGYIPGAPPDGQAATGPVPAPRAPTVFINPEDITGSAIQYSGLTPGDVGLWQINVQIPSDANTTSTAQPSYVIVLQASVPSGGPATGRTVQIYVKHP